MWIFFQRFRTYCSFSSGRGFTLIELLVATSIIVIITTLLLFRHQQFNSSTLLRSLAYSVALSVRQAQLYGVSVRVFTTGAFAPSHGVQFLDGSPTSYYLFADLDNDGRRDTSPTDETVDSFNIQGGYEIARFCVTRTSPALVRCSSDGTINELSIYFTRPDPDANFKTDLSEQYRDACIEIESPAGSTRTIDITNTGQISVGSAGSTCL